MRAREAQGEEAEGLWERFYDQLPLIRNTRRIARRQVPMVVLEPLAVAESVPGEDTARGKRPGGSVLACLCLAPLLASESKARALGASIDGLALARCVFLAAYDVQPNAHEIQASWT
jgi:hypothetical protein